MGGFDLDEFQAWLSLHVVGTVTLPILKLVFDMENDTTSQIWRRFKKKNQSEKLCVNCDGLYI